MRKGLKKEIFNKMTFKLVKYLAMREEKKKIKDERRQKIIKNINLTDQEKKKIDEFYLKNYGRKIPYDWHRLYKSYTGKFDEKYFPELLFLPYFERVMNPKSYTDTFEDKAIVGMLTEKTDVIYPKVFVSSVKNIIRDENNNIISFEEALKKIMELKKDKLFLKPAVDSCSGEGCRVLDLVKKDELKNILLEYQGNFLIQDCIENHEKLRKLHPESVNAFRVITYIWNGKINHCPVILKIGQGKSNVDNAHAGGMFVGVSDDGRLCKEGFTEFENRYMKHPDTGIVFEGYQIPNVDKMIKDAKKMHSKVPQLGIISWDLTIGKNGETILIESNIRGGSIWFIQMAHGCGMFEENTESILKFLSKNIVAKEY